MTTLDIRNKNLALDIEIPVLRRKAYKKEDINLMQSYMLQQEYHKRIERTEPSVREELKCVDTIRGKLVANDGFESLKRQNAFKKAFYLIGFLTDVRFYENGKVKSVCLSLPYLGEDIGDDIIVPYGDPIDSHIWLSYSGLSFSRVPLFLGTMVTIMATTKEYNRKGLKANGIQYWGVHDIDLLYVDYRKSSPVMRMIQTNLLDSYGKCRICNPSYNIDKIQCDYVTLRREFQELLKDTRVDFGNNSIGRTHARIRINRSKGEFIE